MFTLMDQIRKVKVKQTLVIRETQSTNEERLSETNFFEIMEKIFLLKTRKIWKH